MDAAVIFVVSPLNTKLNVLFKDTDGNRKVQKNHRSVFF